MATTHINFEGSNLEVASLPVNIQNIVKTFDVWAAELEATQIRLAKDSNAVEFARSELFKAVQVHLESQNAADEVTPDVADEVTAKE